MLRYFKRHAGLALAALLISILTQLTAPLAAILEQRLVDFIIQGNQVGFGQTLCYTVLVSG